MKHNESYIHIECKIYRELSISANVNNTIDEPFSLTARPINHIAYHYNNSKIQCTQLVHDHSKGIYEGCIRVANGVNDSASLIVEIERVAFSA